MKKIIFGACLLAFVRADGVIQAYNGASVVSPRGNYVGGVPADGDDHPGSYPGGGVPAEGGDGGVPLGDNDHSGCFLDVPKSWTINFPLYVEKFGTDFAKSLMMPTGKRDSMGNKMLVWQDYVAGTDPTDPDDIFGASITIVDGKPVVRCLPELSDEEKSKRKYTIWGKVKLHDVNWVEVKPGDEDEFGFFMVTVEMR